MEHEELEGQSIYRCKLLKPELLDYCTYYAAQLVVMCTHIHHKHLSISIQCCLCKKKSYSSTTMSVHLCTVHLNDQNDWFEPVPTLEGDVAEVTKEILAANLQEIEVVKEEPEEACAPSVSDPLFLSYSCVPFLVDIVLTFFSFTSFSLS